MSLRRTLLRRLKALMMRHGPGMLSCAEFEDFVLAYHEGELDARQRAVFERHMRMCPPCRVSFEHYRRTAALGRTLFTDDPDDAPAPVDPRLVTSILDARRSR